MCIAHREAAMYVLRRRSAAVVALKCCYTMYHEMKLILLCSTRVSVIQCTSCSIIHVCRAMTIELLVGAFFFRERS